VSGGGTVGSFTVTHQLNVPGFADELPYVVLLVELDEQPELFMITNLRGAASRDVAIGRRVEVVFEEAAEGMVLPQFKLVP
jgi:uncharacterized OB-fold protein